MCLLVSSVLFIRKSKKNQIDKEKIIWDRESDRERHGDRVTGRQGDRDRARESDREKERQGERERHRET